MHGRKRGGSVLAILRMLLAAAGLAAPAAAFATCQPIASAPPLLVPAAFTQIATAPANYVRITFVGHASFLIETHQGVRALTDYNGYVVPEVVPDIVTMNNSHSSHYTDLVDPRIKYVLRGWDPDGGVARHNIAVKDLRVRNVPTNLREWDGKLSNGNSMFVFETADLCIVHISHLHHVLSKEQLADLGRIDVAFAPIDGSTTMSHDELFEVLDAIKPMLIIPMHFSFGGVEAFIARAKELYPVKFHDSPTIELSFASVPRKPEVLFLQGR